MNKHPSKYVNVTTLGLLSKAASIINAIDTKTTEN